MKERVSVAVGVIFNRTLNAVLISKRKPGQHLAGYWEFPGGKVHSDENIQQALQREIYEELGIKVKQATPFMKINHDYHDKKVLLDVWKVVEWDGQESGLENQTIKWVPIQELIHYPFPAANRNIVTKLMLPDVCLISRQDYPELDGMIRVLRECQQYGLRLFQLRLSENNIAELQNVIAKVNQIENREKVIVMLNGSAADIARFDVDGIHLKSKRLFDYQERPISYDYLLGASCHSMDELEQAHLIEVDYVFVSPVKETLSHVGSKPLGWSSFKDYCDASTKPVFALGGMQQDDLIEAKKHGGTGIAMIEAVWGAEQPAQVIRKMLNV